MIDACDNLKCSVCANRMRPKSARPAAISDPKRPGEVISIDSWWINHPNGMRAVGLSYFDEASCMHRLDVVRITLDGRTPGNVSGEDAWRSFHHTWLDPYHRPRVARVDEEGALSKSDFFLGKLGNLSIRPEPIAGEAPWQMGKHSRHLKVALNSVYDLLTELEDMTFEEACTRA